MPNIEATNDGRAFHVGAGTSWDDVRGNTPSNTVSTAREGDAIFSAKLAGRGGTNWFVSRGFMTFDTSSISVTPSSATLKVYGYDNNAGDVIVLKSDYSSTLATSDFDNITNAATPLGNTDGSGAGTFASTSVVEYSSEITTWNLEAFNDISLNSDALSDMVSLNDFKVCLINYDHDFLDIEPSGAVKNGFYTSSDSGKEPYIDYTAGTAAVADNATFFGANF
jgi:hypothetical protein